MKTTYKDYAIFTPDEAAAPELHAGPYHFEPLDYGSGEVFSLGYETVDDAKRAVDSWEDFDAMRDL